MMIRPTLVSLLLVAGFADSSADVDAHPDRAPKMYRLVAKRYQISPAVLYDSALSLSGRTLSKHHREPWPWTIIAAGERRQYPNYCVAAAALTSALKRGQPVRIGLMGLSIDHLPRPYKPTASLDPKTNLSLAAARLAPYFNAHFTASLGQGVLGQSPPARFAGIQPIELVNALAPQYGLDPKLVQALIGQESGFDPNAKSRRGAEGLMQLMPTTAARFGVGHPWDPKENLHGGLRYLHWLHNYYHGDLVRMLAAYNAGEGAVDTYGGIPPYPETQHYVSRVLARYARLRQGAPVQLAERQL